MNFLRALLGKAGGAIAKGRQTQKVLGFDEFLGLAKEKLKKRRPDWKIEVAQSDEFSSRPYFRVTGNAPVKAIMVANAYQSYLQSPEQLEAILERYLFLDDDYLEIENDNFESLKGRLFSQPRSVAFVETRVADGLRAKVCSGLVKVFMIDSKDVLRYVMKNDLKKWKKKTTDIEAAARKNIENAQFDQLVGYFIISKIEGRAPLLTVCGTDLLCGLVFCPKRLFELARSQGLICKKIGFAVPTRNKLYLFDSEDGGNIEAFARIIRSEHESEPNRVTSGLFSLDSEGKISDIDPYELFALTTEGKLVAIESDAGKEKSGNAGLK